MQRVQGEIIDVQFEDTGHVTIIEHDRNRSASDPRVGEVLRHRFSPEEWADLVKIAKDQP